VQWVVEKAEKESFQARGAGLSPLELNDVSMQLFRAYAIGAMISAVTQAFKERYDEIMIGDFAKPIIEVSKAHDFCEMLKSFDREHAYRHRRVLEIELRGFNIIHGLMDMLWRGITERASFQDLRSERTSPFARYAYGRISENYRRVFEGRLEMPRGDETELPIRYRELQLLTDMIAGMTDQFAVDLHEDLRGFHVGASAASVRP
jgi:dGTPase